MLRPIIAFVLASLAFYSPAQAATVDYTTTSDRVLMRDLVDGQEGSIITNSDMTDGFHKGYTQMGSAFGTLGSNLSLTFTYTSATPFSLKNQTGISSFASYADLGPKGLNWGVSDNFDYMDPTKKDQVRERSGVNFNVDPENLITAVAHFADDYHATLTITNRSAFTAGFLSYLWKWGYSNADLVTYKISAVPLPAALPLFSVGLLGLAGLRRRRGQ